MDVVFVAGDDEGDDDRRTDGEVYDSTGSVRGVGGGGSPHNGKDVIVCRIWRIPVVGVDEKVRELWGR